MNAYGAFDERRIKHLEMIQAVVTRLGNDSFLIKGWAITVGAALAGFAVTSENSLLALTGTLITLVFWILDSTYLRAERMFRELYERVRNLDTKIEPFFMRATQDADISLNPYCSRKSVFWSGTLKPFYGGLIAATLLVALILRMPY